MAYSNVDEFILDNKFMYTDQHVFSIQIREYLAYPSSSLFIQLLFILLLSIYLYSPP
jgi:hypothetical protein